MLDKMNKSFLCTKLMESLMDEGCKHRRLILMLLSNLTKTPAGSKELLQMPPSGEEVSPLMGLNLRRLVQWFLGMGKFAGVDGKACADAARPGAVTRDSVGEESVEADQFERVADILHNVTQVKPARDIILEPERGIFVALLPQLNSPNVLRRRGIAGMVRNCAFEVSRGDWFMRSEVQLAEHLMFCIHGPEKLDVEDEALVPSFVTALGEAKVREPDRMTRRFELEALTMLAAHRGMREHMRKIRTYPVVKLAHEFVEGVTPSSGGDDEADAGASGESGATATAAGAGAFAGGMVGARTDDDEAETLHPEDELFVEAVNKLVDYLMRDEEPLSEHDAKVHADLAAAAAAAETAEEYSDTALMAAKAAAGEADTGVAVEELPDDDAAVAEGVEELDMGDVD